MQNEQSNSETSTELTEEQKAIIRANFGGVIPKKPKLTTTPKPE